MKKFLYALLVVFLAMFSTVVSSDVHAQGWQWGRAADSCTIDSWAVTTDPSGNVFGGGWTYGGTNAIFGPGVTVRPTGGYQAIWAKYNNAGTALWAGGTTSGTTLLNCIATDPSGNLLVFGVFTSATMQIGSFTLTNTYTGGAAQYFLAKISPSGTVLWAIKDGNMVPGYISGGLISFVLQCGGVTTDASGNIYITGSFNKPTMTIGTTTLTNTSTTGSSYDVFVAKYSPAGVPLWAHSIGGAANDYGFSIAVVPSGDVYICGNYYSSSMAVGASTLTNSTTHSYAYIARFSSTGVPLWADGAGGTDGAVGLGIAKDNYGNVYFTGGFADMSITLGGTTLTRTYPPAGTVSLFLVQYDPSNTVTWDKMIASPSGGSVFGYSIAMAGCGQVWVSGNYTNPAVIDGDTLKAPAHFGTSASDPVFIAGYNLSGGVVGYGGLASGGDDQNGIACDNAGNVYMCSDMFNDSMIVGNDTIRLHDPGSESFYIAKYSNTVVPLDSTTASLDTTMPCGTHDSITLKGEPGYSTYYWSDSSTDSLLVVDSPGVYFVYNIACGSPVKIDTFHVTYLAADTAFNHFNPSSCPSVDSAVLVGPGGYTRYSWSTGATSSSITVHGGAANYLLYASLVTATTCEEVIDTFHFTLFPDDSTFNTHNDSLCRSLDSIILNAPSGYPEYRWNVGATTASVTEFVSGNYWVNSINGCNVETDTFHVNFMPVPVVDLGSDTAFCMEDSITLSSPQPPGFTYLWSTGSTSSSIVASSLYAASITYSLIVTNNVNGCQTSDSKVVTFSPPPVVNLGPDTAICTGIFPLLQSSVTYPAGTTYLWSTGNVTSSITAPSVGTYWEQVTVVGCTGADTMRITNLFDTLDFYQHDTAICRGDYIMVLATGTPGMTYQWLPTAGIASSTTASTIIAPDTSATYTLTAMVSTCPPMVDSFHIDVQPVPDVQLTSGNRFVCQYDTLHLIPTVTPGWYNHYSYQWNPGTGLDDPTAADAVFTAGDSEVIRLMVTTPAGCKGVDSIRIMVYPGNFVSLDTAMHICPHDSVQLIPASRDAGTTYTWHPAAYLSDSTSPSPWARPVAPQKYWALAVNPYGCKDTLYADIEVGAGAVLNLGDSTTIYPGESYTIPDQTNCVTFLWYPPEGLNQDKVASPVASPEVSTKYYVKGTTEWGCSVTDSIVINVSTGTILDVPNAFVPGSTGPDNEFKILKRGIATLHYFKIFNRWGNLVFETSDIDKGWDGTYKGSPQPYDVYVYEIEAETSTGRTFTKAGNVTLIR